MGSVMFVPLDTTTMVISVHLSIPCARITLFLVNVVPVILHSSSTRATALRRILTVRSTMRVSVHNVMMVITLEMGSVIWLIPFVKPITLKLGNV